MIHNWKNCIGLGLQTQLELRTLNWMGWVKGLHMPPVKHHVLEVQPSMTSFTLKLPVMQQSLGCSAVGCCVSSFSQERFIYYISIILMVPGKCILVLMSKPSRCQEERNQHWNHECCRPAEISKAMNLEKLIWYQVLGTDWRACNQCCQMLYHFEGPLKAVGTSTHHPTATTKEIGDRLKLSR